MFVRRKKPVLFVGTSGTGKTTIVRVSGSQVYIHLDTYTQGEIKEEEEDAEAVCLISLPLSFLLLLFQERDKSVSRSYFFLSIFFNLCSISFLLPFYGKLEGRGSGGCSLFFSGILFSSLSLDFIFISLLSGGFCSARSVLVLRFHITSLLVRHISGISICIYSCLYKYLDISTSINLYIDRERYIYM